MVNEASTSIIDGFQQRLERWGRQRGSKVDWPTWWVGPKNVSSRNILVLKGRNSEVLLYIKVRSEEPGFWGLTENRLELLRQSHFPWHVVLLLESGETGYFLSSGQVEYHVAAGKWTLTEGDFKIHEGQLPEESYFDSFPGFAQKLEAASGGAPGRGHLRRLSGAWNGLVRRLLVRFPLRR